MNKFLTVDVGKRNINYIGIELKIKQKPNSTVLYEYNDNAKETNTVQIPEGNVNALFVNSYNEVKRPHWPSFEHVKKVVIKKDFLCFDHVNNYRHLDNKCIIDALPYTHTWRQKIYYGPPGTGKSFIAEKEANKLGTHVVIEGESKYPTKLFRTVFHPEYTYSDFVAKLAPISKDNKVEYRVIPGPLIKALADALEHPQNPVVLLIEEINRGNCAAIFGDIFQLLDRTPRGESRYEIELSELARLALQDELKRHKDAKNDRNAEIKNPDSTENGSSPSAGSSQTTASNSGLAQASDNCGKVKLPDNFYIIATMNTSDESVYYMDSAFKRRWHMEYISVNHDDENTDPDVKKQKEAKVDLNIEGNKEKVDWNELRRAINKFIVSHAQSIRGIEDKQIGLWFVSGCEDNNDTVIPEGEIRDKLLFFLWDNVFARDREPLRGMLGSGGDDSAVFCFDEFIQKKDKFLGAILNGYKEKATEPTVDAKEPAASAQSPSSQG